MSSDRNSIRLRAQEILTANPAGMTTREALKRALAERFKDDPTGLLEFAASTGDSLMRGLRHRTFELPDPNGLFDIPAVIGITTPDGDLLISADSADMDQVRQWDREANQWISTQRLRRKRFREQSLEPLKDQPGDLLWRDARAILLAEAERKQLAEAFPDEVPDDADIDP